VKKYKRILAQLAILFIVNAFIIGIFQTVNTAQAVSYRRGSSGQTVMTIQKKLKNWGYYDGGVDGIYGSRTEAAVKWFQRKNGLKVDGICGDQTLKALGIMSVSSSGSGSSGRDNDIYLLSRIISAEARGEPFVGQVAVGAVIMNRIDHPSFPNTLAGVIYQPGAFSAINDGQFDQPIADSAFSAAQQAFDGWDPTGGAIYYYNPAKSTNQWIFSRPVVTTIGSHVFAK